MAELNRYSDFDARFERAAKSLGRGRPGYPAELYARILGATSEDRFGVALDLGCGAGHSLAGLFPIAQVVQALEPGPELRALAQREFPEALISGATAEDTLLPAKSVDLVTIATAFTWMEHAKVLAEVRRLLRSGGVLAIYAYGFPVVSGPARSVVSKHLSESWDAFRDERLRTPIDVRACVERSDLFEAVDSFVVPHLIRYSIADFIAFLESASFVSSFLAKHAAPARYLDEFSEELRAAGGDSLEVDFSLQTTVARVAR